MTGHAGPSSQVSPGADQPSMPSSLSEILSEIHREFNRLLNVAYLDIKTAFDSVDRRALWKALRSRGIPDMLTDLIAALHENTGAAIRAGKNKSAHLETTSG